MRLPSTPARVIAVLLLVVIAVGALLASKRRHEDAPGTPSIAGTWERTPDDWFGKNPDSPDLPGGKAPLKEPFASQYEALKKKLHAASEAGTPIATTSSRCLPEGMPTVMAALFPIEIIHDATRVVVLGEYLQQIRRIRLDDKMPSRDDLQPSFHGTSVGRWEGDTLVVDTQGIRPDVLLYDLPHGKDMKITERIRLTAPDHLENQVVIEDPETLSAPYKFTFEYKRSTYKIQEYVCENNQITVDSEGRAQWAPVK
jgi:hypothetical protein